MQRRHDVFISYSHKDSELMRQIRTSLVASGITTWTDESIEPGTSSWTKAIDSAIRETGCVAVILSPEAATSSWVGEELNFARLLEKRVFPILARGDEKISVPFELAGAQWFDIRAEGIYTDKLNQLIGGIRQYLKIGISTSAELSRQEKQQEQTVTQQIYQQLHDYRAQILGYQVDNAAQNRDQLAAHIAKLEAERDFKIMDIDFELVHSNPSATREYFLHWLRIHESYWHNYGLAVGYRDTDAALKAKNEAAPQINNYYNEFITSGKVLDPFEMLNYLYLEFVKYVRSLRNTGTVSLNSLKWHFLLSDVDILDLLNKLEQDHIIENMHDQEGNYRPL